MEVDCEGCAGCCIDWHALAADVEPPERSGARQPLDDAQNFVALDCEEVRGFLDDGLGDALTPRLWTVSPGEQPDDGTVEIDGHRLAAAGGRPVFYVGLRKPPKPVAPFDRGDAAWLPTCVFLDPETLQCRVHGEDRYPDACAAYPGYNLQLGQSTECERVEAATGEERLRDDEPPADPPGAGLGPQALGSKLFAHPEPDALAGRVDRIARGEATDEDRATFAAVAAASSPGTLSVAEERRETAFERALAADSWVGRAIDAWTDRADGPADPALAEVVEEARGAPETPGWD